jgi:hypothetical protein
LKQHFAKKMLLGWAVPSADSGVWVLEVPSVAQV